MSEFATNSGKSSSDRRLFPRFTPGSLAYIELGDGNGGIVVNVSEGGLAVQAAVSLLATEFPQLRLQLGFKKHLELAGKIAWIGDYRKRAGIRFVELSEGARSQIREWIVLEARPRSPAMQASESISDTAPVQTLPAPNQAKFVPRKSVATTTIVVGMSAIVALALGWIAGHQGLRWAFVKGAEMKASEIVSEENRLPQALDQIEVIDLENHRWLIPFHEPAGTAERADVSPLASQTAPVIQNRKRLGPPVGTLSGPKLLEHAPQEASSPPAPRTVPESGGLLPGVVDRAIPELPDPSASPGTSVFQPAELIHRVEPTYPVNALLEGIEGTVKLRIVIGDDGVVRELSPLSGPQFLFAAAAEAVKRWRYKPALLRGHPIQSESQVTILFSRSQSRQ